MSLVYFLLGAVCFYIGSLYMPAESPVWRVCKPGQVGEVLVSSSQYPDHTDCFYQRQGRVSIHKITRKEKA